MWTWRSIRSIPLSVVLVNCDPRKRAAGTKRDTYRRGGETASNQVGPEMR